MSISKDRKPSRTRLLTMTAVYVLTGGLCQSAHADSGLFGDTAGDPTRDRSQITESEPQYQEPVVTSSVGVEIGNTVRFRGVGDVFFAGIHDGLDVYYSSMDEPGGYDWDKALTACDRKGDGWLLPTRGELDLLMEHKESMGLISKGIDPSSGSWYWSASSESEEAAWRQRFSDGMQQPLKKIFSARVRCVRVY